MNIGEKLKQLRFKNDLTQQDLADRCNLSKGFISQVENNLASPSIATLMDILDALGVNAKDFFNDRNDQIVYGEDDVFIQDDGEMGNRIRWLIPSALKNKMEPILLTMGTNGRSQLYYPFDGEVFGYVIKGTALLHMGRQTYKLKEGESFYHSADCEHYLENTALHETEVLWATMPPNF
ncbi:MAG: XRE family transcriptional regulator [Lachnospiraceae bacterium]|jgi:transcriptional regulator with XRE-family HTH domain|nr:XRE family transcriptional regulator [Lachnospiraceae bacterium]